MLEFVLVFTIVVAGKEYPINPTYFTSLERCELIRNILLADKAFQTYEAKGRCLEVKDFKIGSPAPLPAPK